ncbi:MAG: PAS domain S-box protein [Bacteroidales bacterium]|nr:PAS domain S-box protein [Bacteroidales bacterium]
MKKHLRVPRNASKSNQVPMHAEDIRRLNEQLTLANEELKITNEELKAYQNRLEEIVAIRTQELKKKEESLNYKSTLEKLLFSISTRFFNLSPERVDDNIALSLQEICQFFLGNAAFLGEIVYSENAYCLTHIWKDGSVDYNQQYFRKAPLSDIHWWLDKMNQQRVFTVDYRKPEKSEYTLKDKGLLQGIGLITFVPIIYQGNVVGFTGFSSMDENLKLDSDEISLLHQIGEIFVNAIKRKEAEKILIESERNYREIFNATSEAIIIYDYHNAQIIDVNQAAIKLFGLSYEEALNGRIDLYSNVSMGFNRDYMFKQIHKTIEEGPIVFEWQIRRKTGELIWTEVSMKNTEIGGDMRIVAVVRDISERKKSQEIIMQSEERFRSIVQFLTDIIWIIDEKINIVYESPSSSNVLGYPPGFLIGKYGLDLVHTEDIPLVMHDLKEVFEKKNDYLPTEFRVRSREGNWISLEVIANNMLDHPAIQGIIITGRDVTERRRVEKALKISETKFRDIFNNSSDAIVILNNKYDFLEVNEVFHNTTGYTLEETTQMKLTDIITDSYLPVFVEKLVKIFQNEYQPALECEINCRSNISFPAEINSKLIEYEGERALISVIRDITERKQLENRILDTIISTEEKEREKFARNLHDELGPLLSSIKMYVNSLSSSIDKNKHEFIIEQLKIILTEVIQSTKELSNDLSPHILSNYGLMAAMEWFTNQLKPYITIELESNLKDERFTSSLELSLYRILKELINNTVKHANATKINIKLYYVLKSIHLYYADNGTGFTANVKNNYELLGMGMSNIVSRCRSINATSKFYNHSPHGMSFELQVHVEEPIGS